VKDEKLKKPRKVSDNTKIIIKFVIDASLNKNPAFWGREGKIAKNLINKYSSDFLLWLPLPNGTRINSLLWLADAKGHDYIKSYLLQYKSSKIDLTAKQNPTIISKEKIGEDIKRIS
jgi:hypothetical protein